MAILDENGNCLGNASGNSILNFNGKVVGRIEGSKFYRGESLFATIDGNEIYGTDYYWGKVDSTKVINRHGEFVGSVDWIGEAPFLLEISWKAASSAERGEGTYEFHKKRVAEICGG